MSLDEIRVEYHPQSGRAAETFSFEDYGTRDSFADLPRASDPDPEPWKPFRTELDFEIAEFTLECRMNEFQRKSFLAILNKCANTPKEFTLANTKEIDHIWEYAQETKAKGASPLFQLVQLIWNLFTFLQFEKRKISVDYKGDKLSFDVLVRPLWEWCLDLLTDSDIVSKFHWDAERHYKYDGSRFERFFDEPWTADAWWEFQVRVIIF
jgi:hypothetical protein